MGRSRYKIVDPASPHFMTCTVLEWLPVFTRTESVQIVLDCWRYQREHQGMRLYGYVILENHLHFIAQAENLNKWATHLSRDSFKWVAGNAKPQLGANTRQAGAWRSQFVPA